MKPFQYDTKYDTTQFAVCLSSVAAGVPQLNFFIVPFWFSILRIIFAGSDMRPLKITSHSKTMTILMSTPSVFKKYYRHQKHPH